MTGPDEARNNPLTSIASKLETGTPRAASKWRYYRYLLFLALVIAGYASLVWYLNAHEQYFYANCLLVTLIGIGTGATELMSRFRDRPFDALTSEPGLIYLALNGGAAALALFLMGKWEISPGSPVQQVLVAGFAAMAFFRSGLFTTKIGDKEVSFGPNLVLQAMMDVLDRTYDRQRASRRAALISEIMGGVDFEQARTSLPEACFALMQNVRDEEVERFDAAIKRIAELPGLSNDVKSMALGLNLMGIVGEDALQAAGSNLGSTIFSFTPLSNDVAIALAKPSEQEINANLLKVCNTLAHKRWRLKDKEIHELEQGIASLDTVQPLARASLLAYEARRQFGEAVLLNALKLLPQKVDTVPNFNPPTGAPKPD